MTHDEPSLAADFPDFAAITAHLQAELAQHPTLDEPRASLVTVACLTALGATDELGRQVQAALGRGVQAVALQEVFHQAAPYVGIARAEQGLGVLGRVLREQGVELPLPSQTTVSDETRLADGIAAQKAMFGDAIDAMRANAPAEQAFIQDVLSAWCFGDTYTRGGIDLATRELLTWVCIISMGGADPQAKAHGQGNLAVGNGPDVLLAAATLCLPWIGFPRTLNGIASIPAPDKN